MGKDINKQLPQKGTQIVNITSRENILNRNHQRNSNAKNFRYSFFYLGNSIDNIKMIRSLGKFVKKMGIIHCS